MLTLASRKTMQREEVHAKHGHDQTDTLKEKNQTEKAPVKINTQVLPDPN